MSVFSIPEMHCDNCIRSLTAAVTQLDSDASVHADLANKRIEVQARASDAALAEAMRDAGFDVDLLPA